MRTTSTNIKQKNLRDNWKKNDGTFSADSVIDAYLKGVEAGKNEYTRILFSQLTNNLNEAAQIAEKMIREANELKIRIRSIHLKADGIAAFTALFIVDEKDFISDHFRSIFTKARAIKNDHIRDDYYFSFSFMPFSPNLKDSCLISDGFSWKYAKIPSAPSSRRA